MVGKRGGGCSTPPPTWRLEVSSQNGENPFPEFLKFSSINEDSSARKLCANLWGTLSFQDSEMNECGGGGARFSHQKKNQPISTSSKHISVSHMLPECSFERNGHAQQPVSPASYSNSMEVTPYNPDGTPSTSLNYTDVGDSRYSLKTSTELVKILNRIWSLEQRHASDITLVKALKVKLDHSRAQAKLLIRDKQRDRQEMDYLLKQVEDVKLVRAEIEDERKLKEYSKSLHQKLARELSQVKSSFSNALKELQRERKARILLENLCDEFAKGIRDYDQKVRSRKQKLEKDRIGGENPDQLVLRISEAWLDERMQMKLAEAQNDLDEKNTIVDKLNVDIENFLQAKRSVELRKSGSMSRKELKESNFLQHSSESFPLNEAVSAPCGAVDEEDSTNFDSHCIELTRKVCGREINGSCNPLRDILKSNSTKKKAGWQQISEGHRQPEERLPRTMSCKLSKVHFSDIEHGKMEGEQQIGMKKSEVRTCGLNTNHVADNVMRNHSLSSETNKLISVSNCKEDSCVQSVFRGHTSPVQQWMSKLTTPDFGKPEASLHWPHGTLKAKLLEARLEGQKIRAKASRSSF